MRDTEESKQKIQDAVETIIREINFMGNEKVVGAAVVEQLQRTHRTLQQNFFRDVLVPIVKHYADCYKNGIYDLRNEDSCNCAEKLEPIIDEHGFRFI
jgi:hypothetical protein